MQNINPFLNESPEMSNAFYSSYVIDLVDNIMGTVWNLSLEKRRIV